MDSTAGRASSQDQPQTNTGWLCVQLIAKFHGVPLNYNDVTDSFGEIPADLSFDQLIKISGLIGLKSRRINGTLKDIHKYPLPAIARTLEGDFFIVAKIENDKALIYSPKNNKSSVLQFSDLSQLWTQEIMLIKQSGRTGSLETNFGLTWFLPVLWKYRTPLTEVLTASFLLQLFGLATPLLTQVIIDKVLVHQGWTTLNVLALGMCAIILFELTLSVARTYIFSHTTNRIDETLGTKLFSHLFRLPLGYFESRKVGETVARLRELENIRQFMTGSPLTAVLDVLFIFVYLGVMIFYSLKLSLITLGSLPVFILLSILVTPVLKRQLEDKYQKSAESQSYLVESISGVQTIKSLALENESNKKWEQLLAKYIHSSFRVAFLSGTAGAIGQTIQKISTLLILWLGAQLVISGDISVGQLIAFQMLSSRVSDPVLRLVQMWQDFQQARISISKIGDVFHSKPEPSADSGKTRLPQIEGKVEFHKVTFRYRPDGPETIKDLSFAIKPGMVVGIAGRSGSGKSTITKLMQRLYVPEAGRILIDGVDVSLADPTWLRRQIGVVMQENHLFSGTVRDNICIHSPGASIDSVVHVAKLAGAHEFILELPEAYDTMVGERGATLSGGQRQRIAIARTLLLNPRVLIFDEATSALDYESERVIQNHLSQICRGRTVFIIAHRLSTIRRAHQIMMIDRGSLVEYGSHQELLQKQGLYHHLFFQQEKE